MGEKFYPSLKLENRQRLKTIQIRWRQLDMRNEFYLDTPGLLYPRFHRWWGQDMLLNRRLHRIRQAYGALLELEKAKDIPKHNELAFIILNCIDLELRKLELKQVIKISKDQGRYRQELEGMIEEYRSDKKQLRALLLTTTYSKQFEYSKNPHLRTFFKFQERWRMSLKNIISKATKFADTASIASSASGTYSTIQNVSAAAMLSTTTASSILSAIPMVGAIAVAVPLVVKTARHWVKNQSMTNKVLASLAIVALLGAVVVASAVPVTTVGIVCGLMTVGVVHEHVRPWWNLRKKILRVENDLRYQAQNIAAWSANKPLQLGEIERHALLLQVERYVQRKVAKGKTIDSKVLREVKTVIMNATVNELESHPLITTVIKAPQILNLREFMLADATQQKINLDKQLAELKSARKQKTIAMVNGLISIVGAALVCIPTPPTLILGGSLLLASSLVGVSLKYNLFASARNAFQGIFTRKKAQENMAAEEKETLKPGLQLTHENNQANLGIEKLLPSQRAEETPTTTFIASTGATCHMLKQMPIAHASAVMEPSVLPTAAVISAAQPTVASARVISSVRVTGTVQPVNDKEISDADKEGENVKIKTGH